MKSYWINSEMTFTTITFFGFQTAGNLTLQELRLPTLALRLPSNTTISDLYVYVAAESKGI